MNTKRYNSFLFLKLILIIWFTMNTLKKKGSEMILNLEK